MTDGALRARRDDVLVGGRVVGGEGDVHVRLHALDRELLAVEKQLVTPDLCPAEELAAHVHRRLGGALRAAQPRDLRLGLRASAVVEELLVDVELDAVARSRSASQTGKFSGTLARFSARLPTARSASWALNSERSTPEAISSSAPSSSSR